MKIPVLRNYNINLSTFFSLKEKKLSNIKKAYTEGIYCDSPANRKLGRVGMTYAEYAEKVKKEKEDKAVKKLYYATYPGGDTFLLTDEPCSKEKAIEEAIKICTDAIKYDDEEKISYDIEEDVDWDNVDEDDYPNYDRLQVKAEKNGSNIDITVIDWNKEDNIFIRNDKLERENKERERKYEKERKEREKEYESRVGWIKELLKYKEEQKKINAIKESEDYINEAKIFANSVINEGKIIDLWGKKFSSFMSTLNKEVKDLESALVFVQNEDQYNVLSKKYEKLSSKLKFFKDLKNVADKSLKSEDNISIKEWLKQFLDKNEEDIEEEVLEDSERRQLYIKTIEEQGEKSGEIDKDSKEYIASQRKINSYKKQVLDFNKELETFYKEFDTDYLTSPEGFFIEIKPFEIKDTKYGFKVISKYKNSLDNDLKGQIKEYKNYIKKSKEEINEEDIDEVNKAYTEGIYADTPANRKLGRVGMSYKEYAEKVKGKDKNSSKDDISILKEKQLKIVQKYNPYDDSLGNHTWIKSVDDIKTLDEMLGENEEDEFVYPDFTPKDAHIAKNKGKVTIYSSHPITEGVFISPSKICAQDYAGGDKVYSKEVNIKDIAWIDGGQGQYTPVTKNEKNNKSINIEKEIKENPINGNTEVFYKNIKYSPYKTLKFTITKGDYGYGLKTDPFLGHLPKEAQEKFNKQLYRAKHKNKKELLDKIDEFVLWLNKN